MVKNILSDILNRWLVSPPSPGKSRWRSCANVPVGTAYRSRWSLFFSHTRKERTGISPVPRCPFRAKKERPHRNLAWAFCVVSVHYLSVFPA